MAQDPNVPKWFADFVVKNADEHAALAKEIANNANEIARAETRTTRWMAILFLGGLTITLSALTIAVAIILNFG